jgi:very-short-patch-repair endonuclease
MDKSWVVRGQHNAKKEEVAKHLRRAMTPAEKVLWNQLRGNQLDGLHFRRSR